MTDNDIDDPLESLRDLLKDYGGPPCAACAVAMLRGKGPDFDHRDCVRAARERLE